jgi:hypothetical protein
MHEREENIQTRYFSNSVFIASVKWFFSYKSYVPVSTQRESLQKKWCARFEITQRLIN